MRFYKVFIVNISYRFLRLFIFLTIVVHTHNCKVLLDKKMRETININLIDYKQKLYSFRYDVKETFKK